MGNEIESKERILDAAQTLFAEKGYDAARVDEIAKMAQVNKALIYYYFKSKDQILDTLLNSLIQDAKDHLKWEFINKLESVDDKKLIYNLLLNTIQFLKSRKRLIKLMIIESLKTCEHNKILHYFTNLIMENDYQEISQTMKDKGLHVELSKNEFLVGEFFTGIMPILNFVVYYDDWIDYYKIDEETYLKSFIDAFILTHFNFHQNTINQ